MQHYKITKKISDLEIIAGDPEKLTSSLADAMNKFNVKRNFKIFNFLKSKGLAVSSLLSILLILPFHSVANVYSLFKCGLHGLGFQGKKDAYYDIKNNEHIDWRKLLLLHAKRFIYLVNNNINLSKKGTTAVIVDDSLLEKTGKQIEKTSVVNDHVSHRFILGFKLLVLGFWDGASFIPLDFSIHRERGTKNLDLIKIFHKIAKCVKTQQKVIDKQRVIVNSKHSSLLKSEEILSSKPSQANIKKHAMCTVALKKAEETLKQDCEKQSINKQDREEASKKLRQFYKKGRLFGLTSKERQEQYKKAVSTKSSGFMRRKEADKDKITILLQMLHRVVKHGIIPDYLLMDSWFFCFKILDDLSKLKNGAIKLVAMVKINKQIFTVCETGKQMSVKAIAKKYERRAQKCNKMKSHYIKAKCFYKGIRVNLFYVRMGKCKTWKLLLTTDLDITFIKLMEVYQIRWSIEIFFKESKQYLNLGKCQGVYFDAQIADTTISMMQHIILSYFKRINYQQSMGGLFKALNQEIAEIGLIKAMTDLFWELVEVFCSCKGVDFMELQDDVYRNDKFMEKIIGMIPEKLINKAA